MLAIPPRDPVPDVVLTACEAHLPGVSPVFVPIFPEGYCREDACHENVSAKVSRDGGSQQYGWAVWEVPDWEVRLEFHSVWQSGKGNLIDVTPPAFPTTQILFVPDPNRTFDGTSIGCFHHPYRDEADCLEAIKILQDIDRLIFPPGLPPNHDRANSDKEIRRLTPRLKELVRQRRRAN